MCDRQIVKECVSIWFGSEEAFEDYARSEVLDALLAGLHDQIFTRQWSLSVSIPILWTFLDQVVSHAAYGQTVLAISGACEGMVLWFCCAPIFMDMCTFFACWFCRRGTSAFHEFLQNLKLLLVAPVVFSVMATTWVFANLFGRLEALVRHGTFLFAGVWGTLALVHFLYKVSRTSDGYHSFQRRSRG